MSTTVGDLLRIKGTKVETITAAETVLEAIRRMSEKHIGCLAVVTQAGKLSGILSERDVLWKVIAEARESGTVGIYRPNGHAHTTLVNRIIAKVPAKDIIWEAPIKSQQIWFIKQLGANVNLGNISPDEVIALEALRMGLRGDTFFQYLPEEVAEKLRQVVPSPEATDEQPAKAVEKPVKAPKVVKA